MRNAFGVEHYGSVSKAAGKTAAEMMDLAGLGAKKAKTSPGVKSQLGIVGEQKGRKIPGVTKVNMKPIGQAQAPAAPKSAFNQKVTHGIDATKDWVKQNPWKAAGASAAGGVATAGTASYLNRR